MSKASDLLLEWNVKDRGKSRQRGNLPKADHTREVLSEPGCADGWSSYADTVNGECPDCGTPTVDGEAAYGCNHSPEKCDTCGRRVCDDYC